MKVSDLPPIVYATPHKEKGWRAWYVFEGIDHVSYGPDERTARDNIFKFWQYWRARNEN